MSSSTLFFDESTGKLDDTQILAEAIPLAKLVGLVAAAALVPLAIALGLENVSPIAIVFVLVAQFVLAVGTGIVLLYVISRAIQLTNGE